MALLRLIGILLAPTAFAGYALKKKSVDKSGAVAGWLVGFGCVLAGWQYFWSLLFFFVSSTILTKLGSKRKKKVEEGYKEGGQRNWVQVFCNGFTGTMACFGIAYVTSFGAPSEYDAKAVKFALTAAFLGHFGCCIGDTWASESGTAIEHTATRAFLVTTCRPVAAGTNGGMSLLGTTASALGGLALGCCFALTSPAEELPAYNAIVIGMLSGLGGSLLDSLLGATVQYSGYSESKQKVVNEPGPDVTHISGSNILDNHQVNFVSSAVTALIASSVCAALL